ncbi:MAG: AbrB/MazE/SpoVT family DNA-binding domain-containing protein [Elusimicrobia bacterium]|nr:AbrB/MazE/SpoVT family DNA-binding domain-containing protein [Elusimicrobiota bacterium]
MVTKVQRWGNSLGLRLPRAVAEEAGVGEGAAVDIRARKGEIIIRPLPGRRYKLGDLLSRVSNENLHAEIDAGSSRGRESL